MSLAVQLGHQGAIDLLASDLICIDEFELDDPSNTRMIDLIIDGLVKQGGRLMVTSNTVPGELGQGRMFIDQFRAQLNRVANAFSDIHVPGNDYRQRRKTALKVVVGDLTSRPCHFKKEACTQPQSN